MEFFKDKKNIFLTIFISLISFSISAKASKPKSKFECETFLEESYPSFLTNSSTSKFISGDFDPKMTWAKLGFDPSNIYLMFFDEYGSDGLQKNLNLEVTHEGRTLIRIDITESLVIPNSWRTSLSIIFMDDIKGRGVGFLAYTLAAAKFFEIYPEQNLLSSTDQSIYAKKVWQRLVESDFAVKQLDVVDPDIEIFGPYQFDPNSLGSKVKDYVGNFGVFKPRLD